ncbi:MAG: beta-galactosidase, partial [Bacteroidales bacterium]|nr:beta-galactosidase [Bacteroidales bacterium]
MKKLFLSIAALLTVLGAYAQYQPDAPAATSGANAPFESFAQQRRVLFNFDWKFRQGAVSGAEDPALDDSSWRRLDLPHDFQWEQPWTQDAALNGRGFKPMCEGWYRKTFRADEAWQGKKVFLEFDGIMYYGDVYVNGTKVASSEYGYIGFEVDITRYLKLGQDNLVAVYANTGKVNGSRWYTGGGLFRDVYLEVKNPTHIYHDGVYVYTPEVGADRAAVAVQVEVDGFRGHNTSVKARILAPDGALVGETSAAFNDLTKHTREELPLPQVEVRAPRLWSPDSPSLYT